MRYLGIDPGVSGGLAILGSTGHVIITAKMPATDGDLWAFLDDLSTSNAADGPAFATLERVSASPQMGVVSAFTFGRGLGGLRMGLTAAGIAFDEVVPRKWQALLGCLSGGDKNKTKARAQQLFPDIKVTHAIADALLLAEYGRRVRVGEA